MNFAMLDTFIRRTANRCGLDITRYRPEATGTGRLATMLEHHGVNLVIDVGANVGQFAQGLRNAGYAGRLLSFEPLAEAHARLLEVSRHDVQWDVAPRMVIGDHKGETEIHVAGNSVSSSVLEMLEPHAIAAPKSRYVATEKVRVNTLDAVLGGDLQAGMVPFLKIDTQGYEDRVLDGANGVVARTRGLQLELSFVPLYEGQKLFDELMTRVRTLGFSVWAMWPGFCDSESGRMLQVDVVFFREQVTHE